MKGCGGKESKQKKTKHTFFFTLPKGVLERVQRGKSPPLFSRFSLTGRFFFLFLFFCKNTEVGTLSENAEY